MPYTSIVVQKSINELHHWHADMFCHYNEQGHCSLLYCWVNSTPCWWTKYSLAQLEVAFNKCTINSCYSAVKKHWPFFDNETNYLWPIFYLQEEKKQEGKYWEVLWDKMLQHSIQVICFAWKCQICYYLNMCINIRLHQNVYSSMSGSSKEWFLPRLLKRNLTPGWEALLHCSLWLKVCCTSEHS